MASVGKRFPSGDAVMLGDEAAAAAAAACGGGSRPCSRPRLPVLRRNKAHCHTADASRASISITCTVGCSVHGRCHRARDAWEARGCVKGGAGGELGQDRIIFVSVLRAQ